MTAHIDPGQSVYPESGSPGVWAGPHPDLAAVPTVARDLAHTDCPQDRALLQGGMVSSEPGHPAGAAGLPLLGVSLVRQLGPGLALKPVPAVLLSDGQTSHQQPRRPWWPHL